jgi:SAM-dependent methyltransferase
VQYDRPFFINRKEITQVSARAILEILWQYFQPKSVVDVGCGTGTWLKESSRLGAKHLVGIDGPWVPLEEIEFDESNFVVQDLENIRIEIDKVELALCIEVAEHISESSGQDLLTFLTSRSDLVLFSAAVPGQGGDGHVNERLQSYWYEKFDDLGYDCFDLIRPRVWNSDEVNVIYKQNMLLYVRRKAAVHDSLLLQGGEVLCLSEKYELDRIHPYLFEKRAKARAKKRNSLLSRILRR